MRRGGEERARLLRGHRPVALGGHVGPGLERDVEELALADANARFVDELGEFEHPLGGKAVEPLHGQAGDREHPVSRVDRLRHTPHVPHGRPVVARGILILDVVVDEGEVVEQLDRGCRGKGTAGVAGQGFVHQRAEHRPEPLS